MVTTAPSQEEAPSRRPLLAASGAVALALEAGWTIALIHDPPDFHPLKRALPSEHELPVAARVKVELDRLAALLVQLGSVAGVATAKLVASVDAMRSSWDVGTSKAADLDERLQGLNFAVIETLAGTGRTVSLAYSFGRSLRATVALSSSLGENTKQERLKIEFGAGRIATLQAQLRVLAPLLGADAASIVGTSLAWWAALTRAAFDPLVPGRIRRGHGDATAERLCHALLRQGDAWIDLLTGSQSTEDLMTPEGYVRAGEVAAARAARLLWQTVRHYWPLALLVALGTAAVIYFAIHDLQDAAKILTEIGAVGAALGITSAGLASTAGRLAKSGMRPIYEIAENDAKAWAITMLPNVPLTRRAVANLRRLGIPPGDAGIAASPTPGGTVAAPSSVPRHGPQREAERVTQSDRSGNGPGSTAAVDGGDRSDGPVDGKATSARQ